MAIERNDRFSMGSSGKWEWKWKWVWVYSSMGYLLLLIFNGILIREHGIMWIVS